MLSETLNSCQIFESGSASTLPVFNASQRAPAWDTFAANLIECNDTIALGISIPCAQNASLDDVLSAWAVANTLIPGEFLFAPVIDGPGGIIPDLPSKLLSQGKFSKIPFISGTNLDEGMFMYLIQIYHVDVACLRYRHALHSPKPQHDFGSPFIHRRI